MRTVGLRLVLREMKLVYTECKRCDRRIFAHDLVAGDSMAFLWFLWHCQFLCLIAVDGWNTSSKTSTRDRSGTLRGPLAMRGRCRVLAMLS